MKRKHSALLFFSALFGVSAGLFAQEDSYHELKIRIEVPAEATAESEYIRNLEIEKLEKNLESRSFEPKKLQGVMGALGYRDLPERSFIINDMRFDVFCSEGKLAGIEEQMATLETNPELERLFNEELVLRKRLFQTNEFQKFYEIQSLQDSIDDQILIMEYIGDLKNERTMIQDSELKIAFEKNRAAQERALADQRKQLEDRACVAVAFSGDPKHGDWILQGLK